MKHLWLAAAAIGLLPAISLADHRGGGFDHGFGHFGHNDHFDHGHFDHFHDHSFFGLSLGFGAPFYSDYYAPSYYPAYQPYYYSAPPVVTYPQPVYVAPPVNYYPAYQPYYYSPPVVRANVGVRFFYGHR
jgi:hypothetical protein